MIDNMYTMFCVGLVIEGYETFLIIAYERPILFLFEGKCVKLNFCAGDKLLAG